MGALTSKPFAFTARPWELVATPSVDAFDATLYGVRVDARGLEVLRMLPLSTNTFTEDWITDKLRYSYDGLKRARIAVPYIRSAVSAWLSLFLRRDGISSVSIKASTWEVIATKLIGVLKGSSSLLLPSTITDLASHTAAELLFSSLRTRRYSPFLNNTNDALGELLETSACLLLFATNLRYELPLLNVRILRRVAAGNIKVFSVAAAGFNYPVGNLGMSLAAVLGKLSAGKHRLLKLFSSGLLCVSAQRGLFDNFQLAAPSRVRFADIPRSASSATSLAFSFGVAKASSFLISEDITFKPAISGLPLWCHASHGSSLLMSVADFVTPALSFTEQDSTYIDLFGNKKQAVFVAAPVVKATTLAETAQMLLASASELDFRSSVLPAVFGEVLRDYNLLKSVKNLSLSPVGKLCNNSSAVTVQLRSYADYLLDGPLLRASRPLLLAASRFLGVRSNFYK